MSLSIALPPPRLTGPVSVEEALSLRRSIRDFLPDRLGAAELGQLLWAAQGITSRPVFRTAPSAGALYPLSVYAAAGGIDSLSPGLYQYDPREHSLLLRDGEDVRKRLCDASLRQAFIRHAPLTVIICGDTARLTPRYGVRGERYLLLEAGHAAQNVMLQAVALNLGSVIVGAFQDGEVAGILKLEERMHPFALIPVGKF